MLKFITIALTCSAVISSSTIAEAADKEPTIGISVPALQNPFWRSFADFAKSAAKQLGSKTVVLDANQSDSKQLSDIEGLIAQGVDCLIVTPNTSAIARGLLRQAETAKVPVVFAERWPGFAPSEYDGKSYAGFVGVDNKLAGYNIAKALYDAGVRKLVAIGGVPGGAVADERSAGLKQFLSEHSDMTLLQDLRNGELRQNGYTDAQNFLSAFPGPGFEGLWTYNDDTALGAIKAFKDAKVIDKIKVASMDLIPEAVDAIKAGEALYSTGGQWAESGEAAVMCYDALNGKENTPPVNQLSIPGVTKSNVDQYSKQFIEAVPQYDWKVLSKVTNPNAKTTDFVISVK
ncbi:substrate-binding domain-containing protein [Phyllobacterium sp. SB3]|uniref:substrate-binding domain-containing protein n=1 Tax=Phyllobacterium sp. SB3 TaxID=3156073 RepID=UPI0032AF34CA